MYRLSVSPSEGESFDFDVEDRELFIGRSTRCEVTVPDRFLSRRHARLYPTDVGWMIEDLGSRNGTYVNGRRVEEPTGVHTGDLISLSASTLSVRSSVQPAAGSDSTTDVPSTDRLLKPAAEVLRRSSTPPPALEGAEAYSLKRYSDRLRLLNDVHQAMARSIALEDLFELILDHIFAQLQPERVEIFMRCSGDDYTCVASRAGPDSKLGSLYSDSLFTEVADKAMAALVIDTRSDLRFSGAQSLVSTGVRTLMAAPLAVSDRALGLIALGSDTSVRQYGEEDLDLLVTLASVAALRIHNLALAREAAERRRFERELTIARRLQIALIPEELPSVPGYQVHGATVPSRVVSGDYYQLVERSDGDEIVLALTDVSGKGISAAILTGYIEAVSSVPIEDGLPPHEIFNRISGKIHSRTLPSRFATMFLGVLSPADALFRFASAGHSPACLMRSSGDVEWLGSTGLPLGLMEDSEYQPGEAVLNRGDTLVVYSDGYTEAEDPTGEEFGQRRLAHAINTYSRLAPSDLAKAVDRTLTQFAAGRPFSDDRTIVIIRRAE